MLATRMTRPVRTKSAVRHFKPLKYSSLESIYPVLLQKDLEVLIPFIYRIFKVYIASRHIPNLWQKVSGTLARSRQNYRFYTQVIPNDKHILISTQDIGKACG